LEVAATQNAQKTSNGQENQAISTENKPFTNEQLHYCWKVFGKGREKESEKVILNRDFELREGNTIHLQLDNNFQAELLTEIKQDLMDFLRKSLHNYSLQITSEVIQREVERRPYTAQEKFEFLANKNPALRDLREVLGLDLVY
jgi:DNA polymerase III subunit gamma/tau